MSKTNKTTNTTIVEERADIAARILSDATTSDDIKLFKVFQLYKDDLQKNYTQLYYALLGWKDAHINELPKERLVSPEEHDEMMKIMFGL